MRVRGVAIHSLLAPPPLSQHTLSLTATQSAEHWPKGGGDSKAFQGRVQKNTHPQSFKTQSFIKPACFIMEKNVISRKFELRSFRSNYKAYYKRLHSFQSKLCASSALIICRRQRNYKILLFPPQSKTKRGIHVLSRTGSDTLPLLKGERGWGDPN